MRKLAQELDAGAASLYWHVGDKEELLGLLLDRIVGESAGARAGPGHWQEQVKELARESRRLLQRHRDAAQLSLGRDPRRAATRCRCSSATSRCSSPPALPPRVIAYAADMFALYVGGFAFEESLPPRDERPARSSSPSTSARCRPSEFPSLVSLADDLTAGDTDERFEFALDLLVRGLEAMADGAPGLAGEPLLGQLRAARPRSSRARQPHPAQHRRGLGELDVAVLDDLEVVAPRVANCRPRPRSRLDAGRLQGRPHRLAVVDDEPEVAAVVGPLAPALGDARNWSPMSRNAMPAHAAAQLEGEQPPVEARAPRRDRRPRAPRG